MLNKITFVFKDETLEFEDEYLDFNIKITDVHTTKDDLVKGWARYEIGPGSVLNVPFTFAIDCDGYFHDWTNDDGTPILHSGIIGETLYELSENKMSKYYEK